MTNSNKLVIGIGECLFDLLPEGARLGGAPANFAYHAGQLLGIGNALVISAMHDDTLGQRMKEELSQRGLRALLPEVDYPTGKVKVSMNEGGIPEYTILDDVAYDHIPYTAEMEALAKEASVVCFGTLAQRNAVSRSTIHRFLDATSTDCLKVFDINLRQHYYDKDIIEQSLLKCNILKINEDELPIVCRMFDIEEPSEEARCRTLMTRWNINMVIYTCGAAGSYVYAPERSSFKASPKVEVVDTVGAGDSFTAAFCSALLAGKSIDEAHELASGLSAYVCTCSGAMPTIPQPRYSLQEARPA